MVNRRRQPYFSTARLAFIGVMAAVVYVVSLLSFPLLGSRVHFGNTVCLLSGLLFGPVSGGLAAGLGSMIYDVTAGYSLVEGLITFASKFAMAAAAGLIGYAAGRPRSVRRTVRAAVGGAVGAWTYVALYMVKSFFKNQIVAYLSPNAALTAALVEKLPASAVNAVFAMICAPLLYYALRPSLLHLPAYRCLVGYASAGRAE